MTSILQMPKNDGTVKPSYYEAFYESISRSARVAGISVIKVRNHDVWAGGRVNAYIAQLDGHPFIMDFSDHKPLQLDPSKYGIPYFKWQYSYTYSQHTQNPSVFPLCVLQDFDWKAFRNAQKSVCYTAMGNVITNNQRIRAGATIRRSKVQGILKEQYGSEASLEFKFKGQKEWWESHNDCLVAVHVPGARNNMLDRGQWELMGLGVCVLSPVIVTVLAGDHVLIPVHHYLPLKDDYSDLTEKIEWCKKNRETCREIGERARELFDIVGPPDVFWKYVQGVLCG